MITGGDYVGGSLTGTVDICTCCIVGSIFETAPGHAKIGLMITDCIVWSLRHSSREGLEAVVTVSLLLSIGDAALIHHSHMVLQEGGQRWEQQVEQILLVAVYKQR